MTTDDGRCPDARPENENRAMGFLLSCTGTTAVKPFVALKRSPEPVVTVRDRASSVRRDKAPDAPDKGQNVQGCSNERKTAHL
ncbi:hypothetical protein NKH77_31715 [Streptomyces sp. M19]